MQPASETQRKKPVLPGFQWLRGQDLKGFLEGCGGLPTVANERESARFEALTGV
jgi:hypothetical protein